MNIKKQLKKEKKKIKIKRNNRLQKMFIKNET